MSAPALKARRPGADPEHVVIEAAVAPTSRGDGGMSLVEVMVAMAVFAIGSLSVLTVLVSSAGGTFDNRARVTAANLAASDLDAARGDGYGALPVGVRTATVSVDDRTYTVVRQVAITSISGDVGTSSCLASGSLRARYKRVSTAVSTDFRGNTDAVRADTLVRAPVFDPDNDNGAIGFLVLDRNGKPQPGVQVQIPGHTRTTDVNGCAFFENLPPQTYVVTVIKAGAVRRDGNPDLSKSVAVHPDQITSESMRIDTGITVRINARAFTGDAPSPTPQYSSSWKLPSAPLRLTSPDRTTPTAVTHRDAKTMTGSELVWSGNVYPDPGGYDAHFGPCTVMTHFDAEPTKNQTFDLPFSPVAFHIRGTASKATGKTLVAKTLGSGCAEEVRWDATTASCSGESNGTSACRLDLAVPAGSWRFTLMEANGTTPVSGVNPSDLIGLQPRAAVTQIEIKV